MMPQRAGGPEENRDRQECDHDQCDQIVFPFHQRSRRTMQLLTVINRNSYSRTRRRSLLWGNSERLSMQNFVAK
jgi:hypothetical protein